MLHIKLHDRERASSDDPMRRDWWGYDPTVPIDALFARNRGTWRLGPRADGEQYAVFSYTGDHRIKFVAEIETIETMGDRRRRAIVGHVLQPDHPLSRRWVGAPAPDSSRNPITYFEDPKWDDSAADQWHASGSPSHIDVVAAQVEAHVKGQIAHLPTRLEDLLSLARTDMPPMDAVAVNRAIIAHVPNDTPAHNRLGRSYQALGLIDHARGAFETVLGLDPGNIIATKRLRELAGK
jgi:hypothetical protein